MATKSKQKTPSRIQEYREEYERWLKALQPYHTGRFSRNYKQYTAYTEIEGNEAKISDPMAAEITERKIIRMFEREPKFFVQTPGKNIPKEITNIIAAVPTYYWSCPERIKSSGSMKSKLKMLGREVGVIGNGVNESYYNVVSDTPDNRVKPVEDFIFDPTKTLKTSEVIYSRDYVDLQYIEDNVEITEDGRTIKGMFSSAGVKKVKEIYKDSKETTDNSTNSINRSGSDTYTPLVGPIQLISRWKGKHCCRFIKGLDEDEAIVLQEFDSILGEDPFDRVMDIEVVKEPYGFSSLDYLNPITHTKDLFLQQLTAYGSKLLNPPLFVDPSLAPVNRATIGNAWKLGGIVFAPPQQAEHKPMPPMGSFGFDMLGYLQQRGEAVSGVSSSLGGMLNPESDRLNKTATGIKTMLNQATGPVKDLQESIEEGIIEPMANKWLKMAGFLMGENEIKYVLLTGQSPKWVRITKGLLTGKIKLNDLLEAELVEPQEVGEILSMMAENGQDPETEILFDVDWVVKVEMGSMAEVDKELEVENLKQWAEFRMQYQIPTDFKKISDEFAQRIGIKEPEQYDLQPQAGMDVMGQPAMPQFETGNMGGGMPQGQPASMPPQQPPIIA
jgi:hypothetical protein